MKLGKLKKVSDLRSIWKNEATDFTKWLAKEENLELLSSEIGMNISLIKTEAKIGDFSVDILAEEPETGKKIVIENQLEKTDHNHLGKIITYASGYEAQTIIWIVKEFRDEHKSAIDWLNENTNEKLNFFGITIELWQIEDSNIAPKFNIVSQPNSWSKVIKSSGNKIELTENAIKQINFFENFISFCNNSETTLKLGKPQPSTPAYYTIGMGITGVWITIKMNTKKMVLKTDIYFTEKEVFNLLQEEYEEDSKSYFEGIKWDNLPKNKGAIISLELKKFDLDKNDLWVKVYPKLKENCEKLNNYFYYKINKIKNGM